MHQLPALFIAANTSHCSSALAPPPRGIHDTVKKVILHMAATGACPMSIETQLVQDKNIPRNLLPSIQQIRSCVYQRHGTESTQFSVSEMRDFIHKHKVQDSSDPKFAEMSPTDLLIISHHEGMYVRIISILPMNSPNDDHYLIHVV